MIAPATTTRRAKFTTVNPQAEPTDAWVRAVAVMLLAAADKRLAERDGERSQGKQ
jgi:hypothetical protein